MQTNTSPSTGFLDLPSEIRNTICLLTLTLPPPLLGAQCACYDKSFFRVHTEHEDTEDLATSARLRRSKLNCDFCMQLRCRELSVRILRTCQQVYREVVPVLYGHVYVRAVDGPNGPLSLRDLPRDARLDLVTQLEHSCYLNLPRQQDEPAYVNQDMLNQFLPGLKTIVLALEKNMCRHYDGNIIRTGAEYALERYLDPYLGIWYNYDIVVTIQATGCEPVDQILAWSRQLQTDTVDYVTAAFSRKSKAEATPDGTRNLKVVRRGRVCWQKNKT